MKYTKNSYLDLDKEQVQLFFKVIGAIRNEISEGKTNDRTYSDFIQKGLTDKTMSILKSEKYITWYNKTEPVLIFWRNIYKKIWHQ